MLKSVVFACVLFSGLSSAYASEVVKFSRYLAIETCYRSNKCVGPAARNIEEANVELSLLPFKEGAQASGLMGIHEFSFTDNGKKITGAIRVVKHLSPAHLSGKYTVTAMLDSPNHKKGKTVRVRLDDFSQLDEVTVVGDRVKAKNGVTLQPELVVGGALIIGK
ncbi:MAG TPA: hypothetical protein VM598_09370 [Bdellovibrionota bacterium]|nr:hypothetical protein [Bdellovibrionota bacterium]